jgi:hypothetical protein
MCMAVSIQVKIWNSEKQALSIMCGFNTGVSLAFESGACEFQRKRLVILTWTFGWIHYICSFHPNALWPLCERKAFFHKFVPPWEKMNYQCKSYLIEKLNKILECHYAMWKNKQNSTCGMIMPCVQINIKNFDFISTMLSVHRTFDGKYIYILKVMRNVKGWNYGMKNGTTWMKRLHSPW